MPVSVPTADEFNALAQRVTALEQNTPVSGVSPDGTKLTSSSGTIMDDQHDQWRITSGRTIEWLPHGTATWLACAGTANVALIEKWKATCYQSNTAGGWWYATKGANNTLTWTQTSGDPSVVVPPGSGTFSVANGQLLRGGQPFIIRAVSSLDSMMSDFTVARLKQLFPKGNAINLAIGADGGGYQTAQPFAAITAFIDAAVTAGLLVFVSDYMPGQPAVRSGQDLTNSCNWYAQYASHYANQPLVQFITENEVNGNLSPSHQAIYNAIRGAGNNSMIWMESVNGNPNSTGGLDPTAYSGMTNIGWCIHIYPWAMPNSQNQTDYDNQVRAYIASFVGLAHSKDGAMPVLIGECGNSTNGNGGSVDDRIINGKYATAQAWLNVAGQQGGSCGYNAWVTSWHWQVSPPPPAPEESDTLVKQGFVLSNYGNQVAQWP